MPTAAIAAIATYFGATAATAATIAAWVQVIAAVAIAAQSQDAQRKAQNAAKDAYNAALRDRYVMVRGATEARQVVLGRARVSGPMFFVNSWGAKREHLVFTVALAAHEIDAIEQIYFNDLPVLLDAGGNVVAVTLRETFSITTASASFTIQELPNAATVKAQAVYGTTIMPLTVAVTGVSVTVSGATPGVVGLVEVRYQPNISPFVNSVVTTNTDTFAVSAFTGGTFTASQVPIPGSVNAAQTSGTGDGLLYSQIPVTSVSGTTVTVGGDGTSGNVQITYQVAPRYSSKARIRQYLGGPGQVADAGMIAAFPGVWTAADTATGIAYLVVELDYDPNAFPGGIPNVSALVRGAKVYDPRSATTAWSDNPALLMRHYAIDPNGGRLDPALMDDTAFIAAANACDTVTNYLVNGRTYTRPLYRAGLTAKADARPQDALAALAQAMAGKWTFIDGLLRVQAGVYKTPLMTLDESWLADTQQVHVQPRRARVDVMNVVNATFADEQLNYLVAQMPRIAPPAYIAEDGTELPLNLTFSGVQFTGQAQHVAGCMLRDARKGIHLTVVCNMKAYPVELFDVINVSLARFGWVNKTFEVFDVSWSLNGGIQLVLKETDASVYAVDAAFTAFDPVQASRLPSPWRVAPVTGLAVSSGTAQLLKQADGTIQTRVLATWAPIADEAVVSNGVVEVRYGLIDTLESTWRSIEVPGADTQLYLTNVRDGGVYLIQARAKNALTSGPWCFAISHKVVGKTANPKNVAGFNAVNSPSGVQLSWTPNTEADYLETEVHNEAAWSDFTAPLFRGSANTFVLPYPAAGTYDFVAKHRDTSGNVSFTAAHISFSVVPAVAGSATWSTLSGRPASFRVAASGFYSTTQPVGAGIYNGETGASLFAGTTRSYMLIKMLRSSGAILLAQAYDVAGAGAATAGRTAATLAADLNACDATHFVIVYTSDDPLGNRLTSGLDAALYRCGASRAVFGSPNFRRWSAYILIGVAGCGAGQGFEAYQGAMDADPNAWCDVSFQIQNGNMLVSGASATPLALTDYNYTGSLDATTDVSLIARGNCVVGGNTGSKLGGALAWDSDVYSRDSFTGGAYASAVPLQAGAALMFGLNSDPTTDSSYTSLDYAWACRTDGLLDAWESNVGVSLNLPYAANDVLAIVYDGFKVVYVQNGVVRRSVPAPAGQALFWDSSFNNPGGVLRNIRFGPLSSVAGIGTGQMATNAATDILDDSGGTGSVGTGPAHVATNQTDTICSVIYVNSGARAVNVQLSMGLTDAGLVYNGTFANISAKLFYDYAINGAAPVRQDIQTGWIDRSVNSYTQSPTVTINLSVAAGAAIVVRLRSDLVNTDAVRLFWSSRYMTGSAIKF